MTATQLALIPAAAPPPETYWEHAGRPGVWRPVTVTCRYGPGGGEQPAPFPLAVTGRAAPRNVAIRRADGSSDVVPVRTLRRKDPNR